MLSAGAKKDKSKSSKSASAAVAVAVSNKDKKEKVKQSEPHDERIQDEELLEEVFVLYGAQLLEVD